MAKIKRQHRSPIQGADLTPMIDVVFLLLIFFMVATSFVEETQQYQVELPKSEEAEVATIETVLSILVHEFDASETPENRVIFRIAGEPVPRADLFNTIKQQHESRKLTAVVIKADKDARYQDIISVVSCLHANDIRDFSLAVLGN